MKTDTETKPANGPDMLDAFDRIRLLAEEHDFTKKFFDNAKEHLDAVTGILKITPVQAALFALLLEHSGTRCATIEGIAQSLKCGKIQAMRYLDDLEALETKHLITAKEVSSVFIHFNRGRRGSTETVYTIPLDVLKAVRSGKAYQYRAYYNLTPEEFYDAADDLISSFIHDDCSIHQLKTEVRYLFTGNPDMAFVKTVRAEKFPYPDMLVLLRFCSILVEHSTDSLPITAFAALCARSSRQTREAVESGKHPLIKAGYLENAFDNGLADTIEYSLTSLARDKLLSDVDLRGKKKVKGVNLVDSGAIVQKQLYFSSALSAKVEELTDLLQEENLSSVKNRLKEQNMQTGFACLFSGLPGTGKTETAYQIARETGRDIMLVDIAETKSMWFGESEKRIKGVFDRYKSLLKARSNAPILLFNEADAVLGKRQTLGEERRGPGQTENAIQNIILQEMENLSGGILIATTNMTSNLDKAFERRFLYKIEFEKPGIESKTALWLARVNGIDEDTARSLASRFDFSGGQIENVARKAVIGRLLHDDEPSPESLAALCAGELLDKDAACRIGFAV
jgi:hypothetical protein